MIQQPPIHIRSKPKWFGDVKLTHSSSYAVRMYRTECNTQACVVDCLVCWLLVRDMDRLLKFEHKRDFPFRFTFISSIVYQENSGLSGLCGKFMCHQAELKYARILLTEWGCLLLFEDDVAQDIFGYLCTVYGFTSWPRTNGLTISFLHILFSILIQGSSFHHVFYILNVIPFDTSLSTEHCY